MVKARPSWKRDQWGKADSIATTHTVLAWNTGTEVSAITSPAMHVSHQP